MASSSLELSRTYTSFSGADIRAVINGETIATLQAVSYAVQREKAPIYVMGRVDPLSFSRGKRGIAGTLVTLMLDRHLLYTKVFNNQLFLADNDEIYPSIADLNLLNNADTSADLSLVGGGDPLELLSGDAESFDEGNIGANYQVTNAWYVDQIPPFDIVIIAANEYGKAATMRIYGVEILNEGSGFSIDDIVIENQMTYVCRTILPWQPLGQWNMTAAQGAFEKPEDPI